MGHQSRMEKHLAASVEYETMLSEYNARYDTNMSGANEFPRSLLRKFAVFHDECVKSITQLSAKTPPLPNWIRKRMEKHVEQEECKKWTAILIEQEKKLMEMERMMSKQRTEAEKLI